MEAPVTTVQLRASPAVLAETIELENWTVIGWPPAKSKAATAPPAALRINRLVSTVTTGESLRALEIVAIEKPVYCDRVLIVGRRLMLSGLGFLMVPLTDPAP